MARVNVFLSPELLERVDQEAAAAATSRSALIQAALAAYLEARRREREEAAMRKDMADAGRQIDALAQELGRWDPVKSIREFRDRAPVAAGEPARRYRAGKARRGR